MAVGICGVPKELYGVRLRVEEGPMAGQCCRILYDGGEGSADRRCIRPGDSVRVLHAAALRPVLQSTPGMPPAEEYDSVAGSAGCVVAATDGGMLRVRCGGTVVTVPRRALRAIRQPRVSAGDRVEVRDTGGWMCGTVEGHEDGAALVRVDGHSAAMKWEHLRKGCFLQLDHAVVEHPPVADAAGPIVRLHPRGVRLCWMLSSVRAIARGGGAVGIEPASVTASSGSFAEALVTAAPEAWSADPGTADDAWVEFALPRAADVAAIEIGHPRGHSVEGHRTVPERVSASAKAAAGGEWSPIGAADVPLPHTATIRLSPPGWTLQGTRVVAVEAGSAAAAAGVSQNDVVLEIGRRRVAAETEVAEAVASCGSELSALLRDPRGGVRRLVLHRTPGWDLTEGLVCAAVREGGPAHAAGVRVGMRLVEVESGGRMRKVVDAAAALSAFDGPATRAVLLAPTVITLPERWREHLARPRGQVRVL